MHSKLSHKAAFLPKVIYGPECSITNNIVLLREPDWLMNELISLLITIELCESGNLLTHSSRMSNNLLGWTDRVRWIN